MRVRYCLLALQIVLLNLQVVSSQTITFQKVIHLSGGETVTGIVPTSDDGYIVMGYSTSVSNGDAFLLKLDSYGDTLWWKTFSNGFHIIQIGESVIETADMGYLVAGRIRD